MKIKKKYLLFLLIFLSSCFSDPVSKENKSEKLLKDAIIFYDNKDYKKAYILLDSLIKIDTTNGEAYFLRGYCKVELDISNSNFDYLKAIKLNYKKEKAYYNLGIEEWSKWHDSTALIYFKEAKKINPLNKKVIDFINICEQNIKKKEHLK